MSRFEEWYKKHIKQLDPYMPPDRRALAKAAYNAGLERAAEIAINFKSGNKGIVIAAGLIAGKIRGEKDGIY